MPTQLTFSGTVSFVVSAEKQPFALRRVHHERKTIYVLNVVPVRLHYRLSAAWGGLGLPLPADRTRRKISLKRGSGNLTAGE